MENLEAKIIKKLLILGYKEKSARSLGAKLAISTVIREPLVHWLETGIEVDCSYEEFYALKLTKERGFSYPNALNVIDWLHREPENARRALSSGIDWIVGGKDNVLS